MTPYESHWCCRLRGWTLTCICSRRGCVNTKICVLEMCVCYLHVQLDLFCLLYRHPAGRLRRTEALGGKSEDLSPEMAVFINSWSSLHCRPLTTPARLRNPPICLCINVWLAHVSEGFCFRIFKTVSALHPSDPPFCIGRHHNRDSALNTLWLTEIVTRAATRLSQAQDEESHKKR